jgi:hypothetical protein
MNKPFSIIFLIFFVFSINAKNISQLPSNGEQIENQKIAFGETFSYKLDDNTSWKIINSETFAILNSGIGSIEKITFSTPGNFEIEIAEVISTSVNDCKHGHFPHKIMIEVSAIKMIFDFATIKFSNEIVGGQSQYGNEISIDVYIESFNNEKVVFNDGKVISAGVGVNIDGTLKSNSAILKQGVNHLVYILKGQATRYTYIMFDFLDINNQTVSYTYPTLIK